MGGKGLKAVVFGLALAGVPSLVSADGEFRFPSSGAPARGYSGSGRDSVSSSEGSYTGSSVRPSPAALGHYARARSMLIEALREYERGRSIAQPDMIFDGNQWRSGIVSRADELSRLLDPRPREVETGVRFRENPYLLNEERGTSSNTTSEKLPAVKPAPAKIQKEEGIRARLSSKPIAELEPAPEKKVLDLPKHSEEKRREKVQEVVEDSKVETVSDEDTKKIEKDVDHEIQRAVELGKLGKAANTPEKATSTKAEKADDDTDDVTSDTDDEEDSDVAKSLSDDEIRERLKKLSDEISEEEKSTDKTKKSEK